MNYHTHVEVRTEEQAQLPHSQQQKEGTTFIRTCFNVINTLSGMRIY